MHDLSVEGALVHVDGLDAIGGMPIIDKAEASRPPGALIEFVGPGLQPLALNQMASLTSMVT